MAHGGRDLSAWLEDINSVRAEKLRLEAELRTRGINIPRMSDSDSDIEGDIHVPGLTSPWVTPGDTRDSHQTTAALLQHIQVPDSRDDLDAKQRLRNAKSLCDQLEELTNDTPKFVANVATKPLSSDGLVSLNNQETGRKSVDTETPVETDLVEKDGIRKVVGESTPIATAMQARESQAEKELEDPGVTKPQKEKDESDQFRPDAGVNLEDFQRVPKARSMDDEDTELDDSALIAEDFEKRQYIRFTMTKHADGVSIHEIERLAKLIASDAELHGFAIENGILSWMSENQDVLAAKNVHKIILALLEKLSGDQLNKVLPVLLTCFQTEKQNIRDAMSVLNKFLGKWEQTFFSLQNIEIREAKLATIVLEHMKHSSDHYTRQYGAKVLERMTKYQLFGDSEAREIVVLLIAFFKDVDLQNEELLPMMQSYINVNLTLNADIHQFALNEGIIDAMRLLVCREKTSPEMLLGATACLLGVLMNGQTQKSAVDDGMVRVAFLILEAGFGNEEVISASLLLLNTIAIIPGCLDEVVSQGLLQKIKEVTIQYPNHQLVLPLIMQLLNVFVDPVRNYQTVEVLEKVFDIIYGLAKRQCDAKLRGIAIHLLGFSVLKASRLKVVNHVDKGMALLMKYLRTSEENEVFSNAALALVKCTRGDPETRADVLSEILERMRIRVGQTNDHLILANLAQCFYLFSSDQIKRAMLLSAGLVRGINVLLKSLESNMHDLVLEFTFRSIIELALDKEARRQLMSGKVFATITGLVCKQSIFHKKGRHLVVGALVNLTFENPEGLRSILEDGIIHELSEAWNGTSPLARLDMQHMNAYVPLLLTNIVQSDERVRKLAIQKDVHLDALKMLSGSPKSVNGPEGLIGVLTQFIRFDKSIAKKMIQNNGLEIAVSLTMANPAIQSMVTATSSFVILCVNSCPEGVSKQSVMAIMDLIKLTPSLHPVLRDLILTLHNLCSCHEILIAVAVTNGYITTANVHFLSINDHIRRSLEIEPVERNRDTLIGIALNCFMIVDRCSPETLQDVLEYGIVTRLHLYLNVIGNRNPTVVSLIVGTLANLMFADKDAVRMIIDEKLVPDILKHVHKDSDSQTKTFVLEFLHHIAHSQAKKETTFIPREVVGEMVNFVKKSKQNEITPHTVPLAVLMKGPSEVRDWVENALRDLPSDIAKMVRVGSSTEIPDPPKVFLEQKVVEDTKVEVEIPLQEGKIDNVVDDPPSILPDLLGMDMLQDIKSPQDLIDKFGLNENFCKSMQTV